MAASQHALQRSIAKLAIGVARDVSRSHAMAQPNQIAERAEEFQIKVSGVAADLPIWTTADLAFDNAYTQASGRRLSELQRPQIGVGFEQTAGVGGSGARLTPVFASLVVIDWSVNNGDLIDGCSIACAAIAPGDQVTFQGYFHLTIQGFGAPLEDRDSRD
jgi:hypothetical protein